MRPCDAAVSIGDDGYWCDVPAPHPGLAHRNEEADAVWCSAEESRRYGGYPTGIWARFILLFRHRHLDPPSWTERDEVQRY